MPQFHEFRSGDRIKARVDLPLRSPHPDFGARIERGTLGPFGSYQRRSDGGRLATVLFFNPNHSASALTYAVFPVQIERA